MKSALLVLILGLVAGGASAQDLARVEALAREGRGSEARTALSAWFESGERARDDVQRALWLRGVLAHDPDRARLDFRRLTVEFPAGPFSGDALDRLARIHALAGDIVAAANAYESLVRDYPGSSAVEEARAWLDANAERIRAARSAVGDRGDSPAVAVSDAAVRAATLDSEDAGGIRELEEAIDGAWAVQMGAFSTRERAERLRERLSGAEVTPRLVLVPPSALVRVRVGRFADDAGARALRDRLRSLGFEALVVDDARLERPAG